MLGCPSTRGGEPSELLDAHRNNGKRFGVRTNEKLTAFPEPEAGFATITDNFRKSGLFRVAYPKKIVLTSVHTGETPHEN